MKIVKRYADTTPATNNAAQMRGDHVFPMKRRAVGRERGRPRPQQRVLQKADAHTSLRNSTAHRNHEWPFTERAGTPATRLRTHKTRTKLACPCHQPITYVSSPVVDWVVCFFYTPALSIGLHNSRRSLEGVSDKVMTKVVLR